MQTVVCAAPLQAFLAHALKWFGGYKKGEVPMGLDMYAYITKTEQLGSVDFDMPEDAKEIAYWRKHPNLHGWMEQLYYDKGGDEVFNCRAVLLEPCDLDALEKAVADNNLPHTEGFFFGESCAEHKKDDIAFIEEARKAIGQGYSVFYTSWW